VAKKKETTTTMDPQIDYVVREFSRYESFHKDKFDKMRDIYDLWKNKPPGKEFDWLNDVHVPLMLEGEQVITPRLFTALFPTDAPLEVLVEGDAPESQGAQIKSMLQHFFRVTNVQGEAHPMLVQDVLFGTGYCEGGTWFVKKGWQHNHITQQKEYGQIEGRPDCNHIDFFEMFPHPAKRKVGDGLPLIRKRNIDAEFLKGLVDDERFETKMLKEALQTESLHTSESGYNAKKGEDYELLEYWGPWDETYKTDTGDVKVNKAVPHWIMVINRKIKIRGIANPYNHQMEPYCKIKLFEDPVPSWFGVGIGQAGKPTQDRCNKIVNQRLDNVDLVLNKQGFYNGNDTMVNTKKLQVSKPGQWHKVSDVNQSIKWMDTPDVTGSSYKEEELAKQDFREATGATAHLMPEVGTEHRTAMGIQMLQGAAGMRFRPILRKIEIDFIQQLAMFYFSNLKQFMTEPEWVMITGDYGEKQAVEITPQQIQAKVQFIPTGVSETMNKETQVTQLLRYKEVTANDPTINRHEINRRIAEIMGFKDIEKFLTPMNPGGGGGLDDDTKQLIQRRMAEGAPPDQIAREFAGKPPGGGAGNPGQQAAVPNQGAPR